ncbi:hypothetical protein [Olleya sp. YS]|uniref:hypothetical protein n=1 Tax=Olleya sp. YS TaxID=3028318 RepID=UPI0024341F62|nr:hypothetical protein [Olleya sp. YS]WGD34322.1 hypothetical protein Ollyesu_11095 [Olleya sp. YS]
MTKGKQRLLYLFLFLGVLSIIYRYLPFNIEYIGFEDKIYAHRVNSIEKLESALHYFKGIELDLVYDEVNNVLDVNHPPAQSIGLDFETYLSKIKNDNQPKLWLDIKNLDTTNNQKIHLKLMTLLQPKDYNLSDVLVESVHPEALTVFSKDFKISYYLPIKLHAKSPDKQDSIIKLIKSKLNKLPNLGLSLQYDDYTFITQHFPLATKNIYAVPSSLKFKQIEIRERLKDTTVAILITRFRALKGNR